MYFFAKRLKSAGVRPHQVPPHLTVCDHHVFIENPSFKLQDTVTIAMNFESPPVDVVLDIPEPNTERVENYQIVGFHPVNLDLLRRYPTRSLPGYQVNLATVHYATYGTAGS